MASKHKQFFRDLGTFVRASARSAKLKHIDIPLAKMASKAARNPQQFRNAVGGIKALPSASARAQNVSRRSNGKFR